MAISNPSTNPNGETISQDLQTPLPHKEDCVSDDKVMVRSEGSVATSFTEIETDLVADKMTTWTSSTDATNKNYSGDPRGDGGDGNPTEVYSNTGGIRAGTGNDTTNVVCFAQGTLIKTIEGERPVEELSQGDLVWTKDAGYQPIRWIGHKSFDKAMLEAHENLRPIRIKAGSLGLGMTERDLVVSQHHRILVSSRIVQRMLNEAEILVGAKFLLPLEGIDVACDMDEVTYVHFLFDRHQIVLSNGAETESLFTGPEALKSVPQEARDEIFAIFPELVTMDPKDTPSVRRMSPGRIGKQLAMQHHLNQK